MGAEGVNFLAMTEASARSTTAHRSAPGVHAADLFCEVCGEETAHRIVDLDATRGRVVSGLARCRVCRTTHRFRSETAGTQQVFEISSEGPTSVRSTRTLPASDRIVVGELLPGREPPAVVHKIDLADGRSVRTAPARDVHTIWVTPDIGAVVKISLVEGRRTTAWKLTFPPETVLAVGGSIDVAGHPWRIVALRAQGDTWREPDDAFPARNVERVYARRTVMPPEGNNAWSRSRGSPASRANWLSRSRRSFSGPGDST
ncbi:MAG: hypothetical protein L3K01_06275 [Thermoplasmata archaeon]|nr:hypothetical protein [Thermoplasmata archaeon]